MIVIDNTFRGRANSAGHGIHGEDLRMILRREGKFSPKDAISVVEQVCRALDCAHTEGVIHRDLKPQNIMRDKNSRIVVMESGGWVSRDGDVLLLTSQGRFFARLFEYGANVVGLGLTSAPAWASNMFTGVVLIGALGITGLQRRTVRGGGSIGIMARVRALRAGSA